MKALVLKAPHDTELIEAPEPEAGPGEVKIKIEWAGICGSDLSLYAYMPVPNEYVHPLFGEAGPHVLGHEFSGTVTAVGADVTASGWSLNAIVVSVAGLAMGFGIWWIYFILPAGELLAVGSAIWIAVEPESVRPIDHPQTHDRKDAS